MAALQARVTSGSVALTGSAAKTVLQVTAPANQRVKITYVGVFLDGTSATNAPAQVRVLRQTTAGTAGSTPAAVPIEKELTETIQTTCGANFSAEPTAGDVLKNFTVPQFMGSYAEFAPFGQELIIQGGGRLGFEINSPNAVNARVELAFEE